MVDQERWAAIRRLFSEERVSISEIGRRLDLDRKTVRRSLRQTTWQPYHRAAAGETLLTAHAEFVRDRAPQVGYSARILYQELRASRGYTGSYETVKRCVAPLREVQLQADRALIRFETPPGQQSQIDWGQATVPFRTGPVVVHVFVLTLGFSRRGFYYVCADERLDKTLRQRVIDEGLRPYLEDNTHAWILHRDGTYKRQTPGRRAARSSQQWLMNKLVT
jgi:transposase